MGNLTTKDPLSYQNLGVVETREVFSSGGLTPTQVLNNVCLPSILDPEGKELFKEIFESQVKSYNQHSLDILVIFSTRTMDQIKRDGYLWSCIKSDITLIWVVMLREQEFVEMIKRDFTDIDNNTSTKSGDNKKIWNYIKTWLDKQTV